MSAAVSAAMRRRVILRARELCEYCLLHQDDAHFSFQVDHIISRKHGGPTRLSNLALACLRCNVAKGTDVGAYAGRPPILTPLYNPRRDRWCQHFQMEGYRIKPLSPAGHATIRLLELNAPDRLRLRRALSRSGRFPSEAALLYLKKPN